MMTLADGRARRGSARRAHLLRCGRLMLGGAATVLLAVAAAGCGSSTTSTAVLSPAQYAYVIDQGFPAHGSSSAYVADADSLFRADQLLRARCMRQAGFRYIPDPEPTGAQAPFSTFDPQPSGQAPVESVLLAYR